MMARSEFSRKVRAAVIERSRRDGVICCEQCTAKIGTGFYEIDHVLPCALGGEAVESNARLLCRVCHREKTTADVRSIRKADRQRDKHTGAMRKRSALQKPTGMRFDWSRGRYVREAQ